MKLLKKSVGVKSVGKALWITRKRCQLHRKKENSEANILRVNRLDGKGEWKCFSTSHEQIVADSLRSCCSSTAFTAFHHLTPYAESFIANIKVTFNIIFLPQSVNFASTFNETEFSRVHFSTNLIPSDKKLFQDFLCNQI